MTAEIIEKLIYAAIAFLCTGSFFFWMGHRTAHKAKEELRSALDAEKLDRKLEARKNEILKKLEPLSDSLVVGHAIERGNEMLKRKGSGGDS